MSTYVNVKRDEDILSMQGFTMGEMTAGAELFIELLNFWENYKLRNLPALTGKIQQSVYNLKQYYKIYIWILLSDPRKYHKLNRRATRP